jgi:hypothetical protein
VAAAPCFCTHQCVGWERICPTRSSRIDVLLTWLVCTRANAEAVGHPAALATDHAIELPTTKRDVCNTEKYDQELEAGPPPTRGECKAMPLAAKERWVAMVR